MFHVAKFKERFAELRLESAKRKAIVLVGGTASFQERVQDVQGDVVIILPGNFEFEGIGTDFRGHFRDVLPGVLGRLARLDANLQVLQTINRSRTDQMNEAKEGHREGFAWVHHIAQFASEVSFERFEKVFGRLAIVAFVKRIIKQNLRTDQALHRCHSEPTVCSDTRDHGGVVDGVRDVGDRVHSHIDEVSPSGILEVGQVAGTDELGGQSSLAVDLCLGCNRERAGAILRVGHRVGVCSRG